MKNFTVESNEFLKQDIEGYYNTDFRGSAGVGDPSNPDYLYKLKNDPHHNWSNHWINVAVNKLNEVLLTDMPQISLITKIIPLTVCVVPRAKADNTYKTDQLLFRATVSNVVNQLGQNYINGTNFIIRHTNTKTTHLRKDIPNYVNDGSMPYIGITNNTCTISDDVIDKDILLIDDIYTKSVNINEDVIQALLDKGAKSVSLYVIGKTI